LCQAFGFEVRVKVEGAGGRIEHSELTFGDGLIMVGYTGDKGGGKQAMRCQSPRALNGANTQALCIMVDDVDAHAAHARSAGAVIREEPATRDYGDDHWADRGYRAEDPEGHQWWFMQRVREPGQRAG
jgi:uncharacterized glyoxalase superfamily protein PhnB